MARSSPAKVLTLLVSAAAGAGTGILLTQEEPADSTTAIAPVVLAEHAASPVLPDNDETIRLAALAGRSTEARAKVKALVEAGASDQEIATWLAPLLVADPDWLETFIPTVPEDRRVAVVRVTFMEIGNLHPGSVWELLKHSPFAAVAARQNDGTPDHKGLNLFWRFTESDLTGEVLFDPGLGFSDVELARYFRTGTSNAATAKRILDEWTAGRWAGFEPPDCVRHAWSSLRHKDPDFIAELEKKAPASLQTHLANFQAKSGVKEKRVDGVILTDPSAEELEKIGAAGVKEMVESRGWDAKPIPLSTLARLTPEVRGPAIDNYFDQLYPFSEKAAANAIASMDDLDLTPTERQSLLYSAASLECNERGDYAAALALATRMPDAAAREKFEREAWEEWAAQDPDGALAHAATLPEGELKQRVEQLANESKP